VTERKLAAILSADVVGYSRLMAEDEAATVHGIAESEQRIRELAREHDGRVVDFTGDNFLAEFTTTVRAVECALEIQREHAPERRIRWRIGLHVGDVRIEGERIFGSGINVAARLEPLAETGGICVSGVVREQLRGTHRNAPRLSASGRQLPETAPWLAPTPLSAPRSGRKRADSTETPLPELGTPPGATYPHTFSAISPSACTFEKVRSPQMDESSWGGRCVLVPA
jgi:class 3 adenylate cyclase